jgi:hypothetical protein
MASNAEIARYQPVDRYDSAMPANDQDQPSVFHSAVYRGGRFTDKRTHPGPRDHGLHLHDFASQPSSPHKIESSHSSSLPLPEQSHPTFINDVDEDPVIPYAGTALDLAIYTDSLHFLRTYAHKTPGGKARAKRNQHHVENLISKIKKEIEIEIWTFNSWLAATGGNRKPRCKYGNRRKLNHTRDDLDNEVCWFHKSKRGVSREDEDCRR